MFISDKYVEYATIPILRTLKPAIVQAKQASNNSVFFLTFIFSPP